MVIDTLNRRLKKPTTEEVWGKASEQIGQSTQPRTRKKYDTPDGDRLWTQNGRPTTTATGCMPKVLINGRHDATALDALNVDGTDLQGAERLHACIARNECHNLNGHTETTPWGRSPLLARHAMTGRPLPSGHVVLITTRRRHVCSLNRSTSNHPQPRLSGVAEP